jgi:uncharacterized protein (DUF488 family)
MAVFYTIGHSNISVEEFVGRIASHGIKLVIDVRSDPYSKFASQFNHREIQAELKSRGFEYLYMGDCLGGKPKSPGFLTSSGVPNYEQMAQTEKFKSGIEQVEGLAGEKTLVLMCSEADAMACHRERLLAWVLRGRGHDVRHIDKDGSVASGQQGLLL